MILRGDVYTPSCQIQTWDIVGTVPILDSSVNTYHVSPCVPNYLELGSSGSCSQGYKLMAQANSENRQLRAVHERAN